MYFEIFGNPRLETYSQKKKKWVRVKKWKHNLSFKSRKLQAPDFHSVSGGEKTKSQSDKNQGIIFNVISVTFSRYFFFCCLFCIRINGLIIRQSSN